MRTSAQYTESLRARRLRLFVDGERVTDPVDHPKIRPAVNAVAATYALAHDDATHDLATSTSGLVDGP
jgi:4-hydroxybutyryl-CoA dehydratase/vinylacetyl-CoA-Delta-isomerase